MRFVTDAKVAADGRMVLPQSVREALGVTGETRLVVTVDGDEVRLSPVSRAVAKLQALYRENVRHDADSFAFLKERRAEEESQDSIV
ncbi:AbrB/MazE/SpoVT family DNA-binding domain-containing protein [Methylobacterium brachiatum]|uniref:AbrB/MazE/SpoVT family DNA-binding domain-containing protein n=1 Tax=Methylobacterium brachiatum TaxID=269660 RepID=UPI00244A2F0F|nr:AbrB/MazE/SpoVT family DNA-binding domain-containing protein [Methylobacterium brachiatum]MDH2312795.1 AbrB/MazE/SpoVT family DNA-binding domain-containing protein [Methylobacterium brachiatum]